MKDSLLADISLNLCAIHYTFSHLNDIADKHILLSFSLKRISLFIPLFQHQFNANDKQDCNILQSICHHISNSDATIEINVTFHLRLYHYSK